MWPLPLVWLLPLQRAGPGCAIKGQIKGRVTPAAPEGHDVLVVLKQLQRCALASFEDQSGGVRPGLKGVAIESLINIQSHIWAPRPAAAQENQPLIR